MEGIQNAILATISSNVKENRTDKVLQDFMTTMAGSSNRTYVSRLDHKHGCCNNVVNWLLFDHHTWIVRSSPSAWWMSQSRTIQQMFLE